MIIYPTKRHLFAVFLVALVVPIVYRILGLSAVLLAATDPRTRYPLRLVSADTHRQLALGHGVIGTAPRQDLERSTLAWSEGDKDEGQGGGGEEDQGEGQSKASLPTPSTAATDHDAGESPEDGLQRSGVKASHFGRDARLQNRDRTPELQLETDETDKTPKTDDLPGKAEDQLAKDHADSGKFYLVRGFTGRLGNVLFQFASALCIAKVNNLTLVVKNSSYLSLMRYEGIKFESPHDFNVSHYYRERTCCGFDERLMSLRRDTGNHNVKGYLQSWRYFEPCKAEVLKATTFTQPIVARARGVVRSLRAKFPGQTLVGIHIRMEDHTSKRAVRNGKTVAPPGYYRRVMAYFRQRYRDVTFVVIALKPDWLRQEVGAGRGVHFLPRSDSAAVDLEVLSSLDHVAVSVGTFGWWAAYRCAGTVLCYGRFFTPGSRYGKQFWHNATDYIYPGWVRL